MNTFICPLSLEHCQRLFEETIQRPLQNALQGIVQWFHEWIEYFYALPVFSLEERQIEEGLPIGLANLGSSCFLNVTLQSIFSELSFYGPMLQKTLIQKQEETLWAFQKRQALQKTLVTIFEQLQRKQSPSQKDLQTLMNLMKELGWQNDHEPSLFERLFSSFFGEQGDSYYTYNFLCAQLEITEYCIGQPFNGFFQEWSVGPCERSVIHMQAENGHYIDALKAIPTGLPNQKILVRLIIPIASTVIPYKEQITPATDGAQNPWHLRQVHIFEQGSRGHTYLYRKEEPPRDMWVKCDDKKVSSIVPDAIPRTRVSQMVFTNYLD